MRHADLSVRQAAEGCRSLRRLAARAIDPVEKLQLNHIARRWLKLAQVVEVAPEKGRAEAEDGVSSFSICETMARKKSPTRALVPLGPHLRAGRAGG